MWTHKEKFYIIPYMAHEFATLSNVITDKIEEKLEQFRLKVLDPEKASEVLERVLACAKGEMIMDRIELDAAKLYLAKCVPDLKSIEVQHTVPADDWTLERLNVIAKELDERISAATAQKFIDTTAVTENRELEDGEIV